MTIDVTQIFIYFFAVIDPIGTLPVFLAVTAGNTAAEKRRIALMAFAVSCAVLVFFIVAGELILNAMHIPLAAFQIAGGIVLFLFALSMIFGQSKPQTEVKLAKSLKDTAIYPLALPSIASPGAMLAAVLLTRNQVYSLWEQTQTALVMLVILLITLLVMLGANGLSKVIGNGGADIISRVMGLILAALATANTLAGIKDYFSL
ncbi:MarC family protein [Salinimonas sediminis]|uniref:UPF0056 membrane protein n=1 Tax=Salinimonas sediminis TaxID=2303538 RepID=A0A346NLJ7_9ALTE|nr:MarC family protein [Salinimonas sediminis]AXR06404.1 MarC family protein [Salinimonas sediminis]